MGSYGWKNQFKAAKLGQHFFSPVFSDTLINFIKVLQVSFIWNSLRGSILGAGHVSSICFFDIFWYIELMEGDVCGGHIWKYVWNQAVLLANGNIPPILRPIACTLLRGEAPSYKLVYKPI